MKTMIKHMTLKNTDGIKPQSTKLLKLHSLLKNASKVKTIPFPIVSSRQDTHITNFSQKSSVDLSKDFLLYLALIKKPVNVLFSLDHFIFEFSKKTYQQQKTGEFLQQLKERKKLSLFYGYLTKKQLVNLLNTVTATKGCVSTNLFSLLERRLDTVLYRSGMTTTLAEARQLIKHKKIQINKNTVNIPSYLLNPGDVVSLLSVNDRQLVRRIKSPFLIPKIFQDFDKKLNHTLQSSNPETPNKKYKPWYERNKTLNSLFDSQVLCQLFIDLLCTRMKLRCCFTLKRIRSITESLTVSSQWNISSSSAFYSDTHNDLAKKSNSFHFEPGIFTLLKRHSRLNPNKRPFDKSAWTLKRTPQVKTSNPSLVYANAGPLQKAPQLWNMNSTTHRKNHWKKPHHDKKLMMKHQLEQPRHTVKMSRYHMKNLALYRGSFLFLLKCLDNSSQFNHIVRFNIKKAFLKRALYSNNRVKNLSFRRIKPTHIEVSYRLLTLIYLYSPQRLNFPFFIDIDRIQRSLR